MVVDGVTLGGSAWREYGSGCFWVGRAVLGFEAGAGFGRLWFLGELMGIGVALGGHTRFGGRPVGQFRGGFSRAVWVTRIRLGVVVCRNRQ